MEQFEFQWPTTAVTFWFTNLFAIETACFGSAWSSPASSSIFLPRTPPFSFHSATASSTPFRRSIPILLWSPVIGPAAPILTTFLSWEVHPETRIHTAQKTIQNPADRLMIAPPLCLASYRTLR